MDFLRILINKISIVFVALILVVSSVNANSRLEVGDWDIDDDGRADALTDGLLFLRYAFELRGDALISGLISSSSEYTTASDIERELALVYDASGDIDGDGNVDALTDGLLLLRYLFGLSGETLTVGVVANGATRTSSSDLEGFIGNLMPSAPYITLLGSAVLDHEQATDYVDAGATAMDYADGSVAVSVSGSVNSSVAGVYVLTYTAVDSEGNTAKPLTRTVTVADTTAPVITLLGESTVEVDQNASYTDAGATATDAVDGSVEVVTSGSVDTTAAGTYTITYTATDTSNNSASVSRTVGVLGPKTRILNVFTNGEIDPTWDEGFNGADSGISWGDCSNDGGEGCPNIAWELVDDPDRGQVIQIEHSSAGQHAIFFIKTANPQNLSVYAGGQVKFDIKTISGDSNYTMKIDCVYPCTSGDRSLGVKGQDGWEEVSIEVDALVNAGLSLVSIDTGIVIWASQYTDTVFQIDNIRWEDTDGDNEPEGPQIEYNLLQYGKGNVSDVINPSSYRCAVDYGNWIYNAGVVEPAIPGCNAATKIPTGTPTKIFPQIIGNALHKNVPTHKWWGSIPFRGEMRVGDVNDTAHLTADPIRARVSNRGLRVMGLPGGYRVLGNFPQYNGPEPFAEVFDGVALANSEYSNMEAFLENFSDGSVTVRWMENQLDIMDATLIHGSPYIFISVYRGDLVLKTKASDGAEKGIFHESSNGLGIWTNVAGIRNNFLINSDEALNRTGIASSEITIDSASKEYTLTYLPNVVGTPDNEMIKFFEDTARNVVSQVSIEYEVDKSNNSVTVNHSYEDQNGNPMETIAGLHPLHWKHSAQALSPFKIRSARGVIRFAKTTSFNYQIPFVGVLPFMPTIENSMNLDTLRSLVTEFIDGGESSWINSTDTYWSGKAYGKAAELAAIARSIDMDQEANQLISWLKAELEDWFTAETDGRLDVLKYFVYDETWDTLLGIQEAYGSHQRLADHHFHYGYFVRAASEICRVDRDWCSGENFGPMIELLIRDFAGGDNDEMFPSFRNFDQANGFSWADGRADALQGNNNESTSEAANAYGAIILYGLIMNKPELVDKGIYLHASTAAAYWQYWNNIDGYNNLGGDYDNFPQGYDKITTSIIWSSGADFATWFSGAYAHILGIQGLPSNPLILHVGQYSSYMRDYVALGLSESSNSRPSGLIDDQWRDLWWNLWAMTDATSALEDFTEYGLNYDTEAGESKAHTYHWLHTFDTLGQLKVSSELASDYPAALVFEKNASLNYVIYNFNSEPLVVSFSNGKVITALPNSFTIQKD